MIKAILFDLGGVLFTNGTKQFIKEITEKYNLDIEKVKDLFEGQIGSQYREAKISRDEFWKNVIEKLNLDEDANALEEKWTNGYKLIEETKSIILELSKKYKIYYLSDSVRERINKLDNKYHFLELFTDGVFSHEVGVRKPNPQIYQYALKKAEIKPNEAIFIDDKQSALEPAKEIGITTTLFETPQKLREELIRLGIL